MAEVVLAGITKRFKGPNPAAGRRSRETILAVLRGIDLKVDSGHCFALLGPSGCGKTTLLRVIAGLERPDAGGVFMDRRDVTGLPPERRPTAMVFQNYALFPHLNVAGNVAFGLRLRHKRRQEIDRRVNEMLELVHLSGLHDRRIDQLSGGQQQRVALARALVVEPRVLLLDEPLSNLDASLRRSTRSAIRDIQTALGLTTIYITHDQEEALAIADKLALMSEGRIIQTDTPKDLFERPATVEAARFLGQRNVLAARVQGVEHERFLLALREDPDGAMLRIARTAIARPGDLALREGDHVWLALRPEDIVIEKKDASAQTSSEAGSGWPAEVLLVSFASAGLEIEVRLRETGEAVRVAASREKRSSATDVTDAFLRRGDSVRLSVHPGAGLIYRRESSGVPAFAGFPSRANG
jgi:ABC-type Fe3+/spermidine/putrescine transport system ATPase subunit